MSNNDEIENEEIRALVADLGNWQVYIQESREQYRQEQELAERVFGPVVREVFGADYMKKQEEE